MEDRPNDPWSPPPAEPYGGTPPPPPVPPSAAVIPWEDPAVPWPSAFVSTIGAFYSGPRAAFARVPVRGDVLRPLVFAILVGWIGQLVYAVWEVAFGDLLSRWMPEYAAAAQDLPRGYYIWMMALAPLLSATWILAFSALAHLILSLLGGAKSGFVATFRAMCYAQVAMLVMAVPLCGGILTVVAGPLFSVVGLSELHRTGIGKPLAAVLLPVLLCGGCVALLAVMFVLGTFGALSGFPK